MTLGEVEQLKAYAYYTTGMLFRWNTNRPDGTGGSQKCADRAKLALNAYPEVYQDFTSVTGLAVTPTVTPCITGSYGIFTPQDTPIVGELSIFDISLGYDNPLGATFCVGTCLHQGPNEDTTITGDPVGILVDSAGFLVPHAGILDSITQLLTWDGRPGPLPR